MYHIENIGCEIDGLPEKQIALVDSNLNVIEKEMIPLLYIGNSTQQSAVGDICYLLPGYDNKIPECIRILNIADQIKEFRILLLLRKKIRSNPMKLVMFLVKCMQQRIFSPFSSEKLNSELKNELEKIYDENLKEIDITYII